MTPRQARAARAVLQLSVRKLSNQSGVSESSIRRIEAADEYDGTKVSLDMVVRLQTFFAEQGILFRFDDAMCVCWKPLPQTLPTWLCFWA